MIVVKFLGVSLGAGCMAELNIGILLSCLDHVVLVTERVSEDDGAALIHQILGSLEALLSFGDVGLVDKLGLLKAESLKGFVSGLNEVEVIGGVFIVQEDESYLDSLCVVLVGVGLAAGSQRKGTDKGCNCQKHCKNLSVHWYILRKKLFF